MKVISNFQNKHVVIVTMNYIDVLECKRYKLIINKIGGDKMKMRAIVQLCNRVDYLVHADFVKLSAYRLTVSKRVQ